MIPDDHRKGDKMKFIEFEEAEISKAADLIPGEQRRLIAEKGADGGFAVMAGEYIGAAVWRAADEVGELLSLYVLPEARRLGAGTLMMESVVRQMRAAKLKDISFKYSDMYDRTALTPFFNDIGFETDVVDMPLGSATLKEIAEGLIKNKADKAEAVGECLYDLPKKDSNAINEELYKISGQDMSIYDVQWPGTYVIRDTDGGIMGAAFMREEREDILSLDYLFNNGSPKVLMGFLKKIVTRLDDHYGPDTRMEMLLATDEGEKLFESLIGDAEETYKVASCRQSLSVM